MTPTTASSERWSVIASHCLSQCRYGCRGCRVECLRAPYSKTPLRLLLLYTYTYYSHCHVPCTGCGRGSHVRRAEIILLSSTATLVWKLFSAVIARALSRPTCLHAARATRSQHYWPLPVLRPLHFSSAQRLPRSSSSSSGTAKRFEYDCDASVKRARGACTATVRYTSRRSSSGFTIYIVAI